MDYSDGGDHSLSDGIDTFDVGTKTYMPQCADELKPKFGQSFNCLEDGIKFYQSYALVCGFDIRLGSTSRAKDKTILWKYILCNREGEKNAAHGSTSESDGDVSSSKRRRVSRRFNCLARIVLKYSARDGYVVNKFIEEHTHTLVPDAYKQFMKVNRNLDFGHQQFVLNCARANIGSVKSFRLFKEVVGGYSRVGCNVNDFKKISRDLHAFALGKDAQMVIDKLCKRRELCPAFFFDYFVDENEKLKRLFWSDPISTQNYHYFGDVVAFDATYEMNRYNMIFAPFTGKDNHGKCVTFGAALISNEDVESYNWVFDKFLTCMGRAPKVLISDQDPAMKIAIEKKFPGTRHRLCMWHIMKKVKEKVPKHLKNDEVFRDELNENVWSTMIEPEEFEIRWFDFINSFDLSNNAWFSSMYIIRHSWIPAYFRDLPLSGILRTTSICESENSFFGKYLDKNDNLVEFFMHFESAMDSQRYTHDRLNIADQCSFPEMMTKLQIEKHAATVFTASIFKELQFSIDKACHRSQITSVMVEGNKKVFTIDGCTVTFDSDDKSVVCSCKKFVRVGFVCSHMFVVFQNLNIHQIPDQYILSRWSKNVFLERDQAFRDNILHDAAAMERNKISMNHVYSEVHCISGLVQGIQSKIYAFMCCLRKFKEDLLNDEADVNVGCNKERVFQEFYGIRAPDDVSVLPPDPVKTKGSGSRIVSRREKAIRDMNKQPRRCSKCKQLAYHDARNCDKGK